ncbi:hypothetical protein [Pseudovibrio japonicus]|uniref:hypothetical protein n=1 Tax=Pseudovibrio japonicus TaxID=366534 RepID=UPI00167835CB|nr:hypothetical protein [Pseudovibrio japonicus]
MNEHSFSKALQNDLLSSPGTKLTWLFLGSVVFRVVSALTTIMLIYFLTAGNYGELMTVVFWSQLIGLVSSAGLADLIIKRRSMYSMPDTATQVLHAWAIAIILGATLVFFLYVTLLRSTLSQEANTVFFLCASSSIFLAMNYISQGAMRSSGKVITQAQMLIAAALVTNSGLVFIAWKYQSLLFLGYWYLVALSILFLVNMAILVHYGLFGIRKFTVAFLARMLQQTLPYGIVQVLYLLLPILSSTIVLVHFGKDVAGSNNVVMALFMAAANIALILDHAFFPMLSVAVRGRGHLCSAYFLMSIFLSLPALALFGFHGDWIASIFPAGYTSVNSIIIVLAFLIPIRFGSQCLSVVIRLGGSQRITILSLCAAVSLLGMYGLCMRYIPTFSEKVESPAMVLLLVEANVFLVLLTVTHTILVKSAIFQGLKAITYSTSLAGVTLVLLNNCGFVPWFGILISGMVYIGTFALSGSVKLIRDCLRYELQS